MSARVFFVCLLFVFVAADSLPPVNNRFRALELLEKLAESISWGHANKGFLAQNCTCSFHACSNNLDHQEICTDRFGTVGDCGTGCESRKVSLERSYMTTPPYSDPNDISPLIAEEACIYQGVNELFREYEPSLYSWVYFGTAGGAAITYPGVPVGRGVEGGPSDELLGNCEQYDPRVRPWYLDATSAPKDLIILIDASSTMAFGAGPRTTLSRWDIAKNVAITVIDMVHFADAVNVIVLGEDYFRESGQPDLLEASDENKQLLKNYLDQVTPSGRKMTTDGLRRAFHTFRRAQGEEIRSTGCQQVILWISDGLFCSDDPYMPCDNEHEALHDLIHDLEEEQETLGPTTVHGKASIFVATVGDGSSTKLARHLSCTNNGTWMPITAGQDLLEQMRSYSSFFAGQLKENDDRVMWSRFYEDFAGLGTMTTATRPMFTLHASGSRRGKLLGVIGLDVPLTRLAENGLRYEEVVGQLSQGIGQCNVYPIDQCQLQCVREEDGECPNVFPPAQCYEDSRSGRVYFATHLVDDHWTFEEARTACEEMNGKMAEIRSRDDQSFISSIASFDGSWIGLTKPADSHEWTWLSGRNRDSHHAKGFWATDSSTPRSEDFCAAIDSRGTRKNVEPMRCNEGLHLLCEFRSARKARRACGEDIHVVDPDVENPIPSIEYCLRHEDHMAIMHTHEFLSIRTRQNGEPVFCPMNLETPVTSVQAQCCGTCQTGQLSAQNTEVHDDESDAIRLRTHFVFILFASLLPLFVVV